MASTVPIRSFVAAVGVKIPVAKTITSTTGDAVSPIVVTSTAHGFTNGQEVNVVDVLGNTAANGTWVVANVAANTFELVGSTGNGAYISGGTATLVYDQPVAADCFAVYNWNYEHTVDFYQRTDIRGNLMVFPSISGARSGKVSFSLDMKGSGTAGTAPEFGEALKMCGMGEVIDPGVSVIYKPLISVNSPCSVAVFADGQ